MVDGQPPNLVVMGVGHSGTTIVTRMLHALGWNLPDASPKTDGGRAAESDVARIHDKKIVAGLAAGRKVEFNDALAGEVVTRLCRPFVFKNPRFVITLRRWAKFLPTDTVLIWVVRNLDAVEESHRRRRHLTKDGQPGDALTCAEHMSYAQETYDWWPRGKITVRYEDLAQAVSLFRKEDGE